jgi:predicted chitinase
MTDFESAMIDDAVRDAAVGIGQKMLVAREASWLKRSPLQSSELDRDQKFFVEAGFTLPLIEVGISSKHYAFRTAFSGFSGEGYAFVEHFDLIGDIDRKPELVTRSQAEYIFETAINDDLFEDLNEGLEKFGIIDKEDIRQFLAQCAHESGGLKWLKEFATGDDYEWREDLGNNQEGDGRKFKGAGAIQLTGRANYQSFADFIGDQNVVLIGVDYVAQHYPISSACFFWWKNGISDRVKNGATIRDTTRIVNGGFNGLDDRLYYYQRALDII